MLLTVHTLFPYDTNHGKKKKKKKAVQKLRAVQLKIYPVDSVSLAYTWPEVIAPMKWHINGYCI